MLALLSAFNLIVVSAFIFIVGEAGFDDEMPKIQSFTPTSFDLNYHLIRIDSGSCQENFPYQIYADSANSYELSTLVQDLSTIESRCGNSEQSMRLVHGSLTDTMYESLIDSNAKINVDEVMLMLDWADRFKYYAIADQSHDKMHRAIHTYWMEVIVDWLEDSYEEDYFVKYSYKFNFIRDRCEQSNYKPSIGSDTTIEKILDNLVLGKWGYLINRFWIRTGALFKIAVFVLGLLTFYAYGLVIRKHFFK